MFHNSSHKRFWIFKSEDELEHLRCKANQKFRNKILESGKVSSSHANVKLPIPNFSPWLWFLLLYESNSLEPMNPYFWSGMKKTFYSDTTRGECWISVTHLNQQCPNLSWYVCFFCTFAMYVPHRCDVRAEACLNPARVQGSCTSEDSTWTTPSWNTIPGLSCKDGALVGILMFDCHSELNRCSMCIVAFEMSYYSYTGSIHTKNPSYYRKSMLFMVMIWYQAIVFSQVDVCVPVL